MRGISLKLQEEERERRMDFVPTTSALEKDVIEVDAETNKMLQALGLSLPKVQLESAYGGKRRGPRRDRDRD